MTTNDSGLEATFCIAQTATIERMEEIVRRYCEAYPLANLALGEVVADLRLILMTEHTAPAPQLPPEVTPAMWKEVVHLDVWPLTPASLKKLYVKLLEFSQTAPESEG